MKVQAPEPSVVAVPATAPSMVTATVEPASAAPEIVGVLSAVAEPLTGAAIVGAAGGIRSTVKVFVALSGDRFPAGSLADARTVCEPSARVGEA